MVTAGSGPKLALQGAEKSEIREVNQGKEVQCGIRRFPTDGVLRGINLPSVNKKDSPSVRSLQSRQIHPRSGNEAPGRSAFSDLSQQSISHQGKEGPSCKGRPVSVRDRE